MSGFVAKRPKIDGEGGNMTQIKATPPKKTCDWFTQKFAEIVNSPTFVDKTLFIKAFLQKRCYTAVLAPRGFGKTLNMDMVREFVSGNRKLFEDNNLKIYEEEKDFFIKYCQHNPVIHLDFKSVSGKTKEEVYRSMRIVLQRAYDAHKYLVKQTGDNYSWSCEKLELSWSSVNKFVRYWKNPEASCDRLDMLWGCEMLSEILHEHYGKRVYVFIDSYDAPITQAIMQTNVKDDVVKATISFIDDMMRQFLKDNKHVKQALINACVETGDIRYNKFPKEFSRYFGFTDDEVKALFQRDEFVAYKNEDEIRNWYSGYRRTKHTNMYRSYSIIQYLDTSRKMNKPQFNTYWLDSDCIPNLTQVFTGWKIRRFIEELINDKQVDTMEVKKIYQDDDILQLKSFIQHQQPIFYTGLLLQFLSDHGYLNAVSVCVNNWRVGTKLSLPNKEIKKLLQEKCYNAEFFEQQYRLLPTKIRDYVEALGSLLQRKTQNAFISFASSVSELFDGALTPKADHELDSILVTLLYNFKLYRVESELRVQRIISGRILICFYTLVALGDVDMIIGVKCNDITSSEKAYDEMLADIGTENDIALFKNYRNATSKIFLGLHMNQERKVSLTYTIDHSAKQTVTSNDWTSDMA